MIICNSQRQSAPVALCVAGNFPLPINPQWRVYAVNAFVCLAICAVLTGCASAPRFVIKPPATAAAENMTEEGDASYYADDFNGHKTASGETYDMNALTAAHRTLPFNSMVKVTNLENGKSVTVRINDRGPFKDDRLIDLSLGAAKQIGMIANGTAKVHLEVLELGQDTAQGK
jgi:rare lipoprotein A (peptidoglycan hydrolase)